MLAIADERFLYLLEFVERRGLEREIERLRIKTKVNCKWNEFVKIIKSLPSVK